MLLSKRELQILTLASRGYSTKVIVMELGVAYSTVRNQKVSLFEKIGARNMVHAVALAMSQDLIPDVS